MDKEKLVNKKRASSLLLRNLETMCSCGGGSSVNRSKFFCIVFSFNLLLVLLLVPEQIMGKVMSSSEKGDLLSSSSAQTPESTEEEAPDPTSSGYIDDDAVKFVMDEDEFVYDDEITHHHNDHYQQNLRGGNTRIALHQEKCPPLPEPNAVASSRLCEAKMCQTDEDCSRDDSVICCYNGCIHSCLPKVNPPVAFDWVEETELKQFSDEGEGEDQRLAAAESRPETVSLPGGCHLDMGQYEDLNMFRKLDHVKTCKVKSYVKYCIKRQTREFNSTASLMPAPTQQIRKLRANIEKYYCEYESLSPRGRRTDINIVRISCPITRDGHIF